MICLINFNTKDNKITIKHSFQVDIFVIREYSINMIKPQDILVLMKLISLNKASWTYAKLAGLLKMSPSEVHAAIKRLTESKLYNDFTKEPIITAVKEFIMHGIKFIFPVKKGGQTRGILTSYAAKPLSDIIVQNDDLPPVWPYFKGSSIGLELKPLYKSVPEAINGDPELYELLTLIDAIRSGSVREQNIAKKNFEEKIEKYGK